MEGQLIIKTSLLVMCDLNPGLNPGGVLTMGFTGVKLFPNFDSSDTDSAPVVEGYFYHLW